MTGRRAQSSNPRVLLRCAATGKLTFDSRRKARHALRAWQRQHLETFHGRFVYRCPHCGSWHLTSQERA